MSDDVKGTDTPGQTGVPGQPTDAELASMSRDELLELGGKLDGVEIVYKDDRWPVPGTKAEKRAERSVANWLLLGGFSGLALLLVFLFWPWEYKPYGSAGELLYSLATPLYGLTFGLSILAIGIGAVLFQKKFIPEEITIQDRHDGRSPEIQRKTIAANLTDALESSTIKRRKLIGLSLGIGLGAFGAGHPGRVRRRPDQEPVEAGGPDRRRQEGRAVDVGLDPEIQRRDHLPGPRHRKRRPRSAVRQDAPRGPRRRRHGNRVPVARVRRRRHHQSNHTTGSARS